MIAAIVLLVTLLNADTNSGIQFLITYLTTFQEYKVEDLLENIFYISRIL